MTIAPDPHRFSAQGEDAVVQEPDVEAAVRAGRLVFLDQIRAVAALYVAVYHALLVIWPNVEPGQQRVTPPWYLRWADFGHVSVAVFIVVSGFSLALRPARRGQTSVGSYWTFMRKRARRLLPPYWVALAASVLMLVLAPHGVRAGAGSFSKGPVPAHSVVAFTLLLQDVFSRFPSPNSPMWSIAVEWHLYFVFPLLLALGARFGMRKMVVGAAVVGVTLHYVLRPTAAIGTAPHFLAMFAAGIAAAYLVRERPLRRVTGPAAARLGWAFIALAWLTFGALAHWEMGADLLVGLLVATALWILASQPPPVPTGRLGRSLVAVGLVSYSLYLVHSPIEKVLWTLVVSKLGLGQVASLVVLSLSGISVALLAAWVMFRLVEQPSMRWSARAGRSPVGAGSPLDPREGSNR